MKVLTIVLEESLSGQKKLSYYGNMPLNEAFALIHEAILKEAKDIAVEAYKKEDKNGDNL